MASPYTISMPTFEITQSSVYVVKKYVDGGSGDIVLGQVANANPQSNIPSRKLARLGDTNKHTTYQPAEHSMQLQMYSEFDPDQLAAVLGGTTKPISGGWASGTNLRLNPSVTAYDLVIEVYKSATGTSADVFQGEWIIDNFKPTTLNVPIGADSEVTYTLNGECDDIYYMPVTALGA
jgi:hypothetical protein